MLSLNNIEVIYENIFLVIKGLSLDVSEGQIIALHNGRLVCSAGTLEEACLGLLEKANAAEHELITMFYGAGVAKSKVNQIADLIRARYPEQEVEVQEGGQPHYQFIFSIE